MVEEYLLLVEQKEENAFQFLTKAATKVNITLAGDVGTELLDGFMVIEMKKYTFTKEERLCSKRLIDDLFHNGSSFVVYPFRVVFLLKPESKLQQLIGKLKNEISKSNLGEGN
ncbi:ribonuclease P [Mycobacterium tuberculosis]|nr:ribonuclease P [Mycobacterium tuberculosis]